jgi:DNA-binding LacI/PurR family transcriptional regulator
LLDPFLTAATQPADEMGRRATELLLAHLGEQEPSAPQEIVLPTSIIFRRSTAPPPALEVGTGNAQPTPEIVEQ